MKRDKALIKKEAEVLINTPLLGELLDGIEQRAIDVVVLTNDEQLRTVKALEVRALRNLRNELMTLSRGKITG